MILTHGANSISRGGSQQNEIEIGGRWYPYVQIGNQLWLAENLDYKFPGCVIGQSGSTASESRANYYDNNESTYGVNGNKYGLLYNWIAVNYLEQNKLTLLPPEWHIPTKSDSESLITFVGGSSIAGTKLKSTTGWNSGNGDGTYGFNAFPDGGFRDSSFSDLGLTANYWTLTLQEYSTNRAYFIRLDTSPTGTLYNGPTHVQYNIRLVKDAT